MYVETNPIFNWYERFITIEKQKSTNSSSFFLVFSKNMLTDKVVGTFSMRMCWLFLCSDFFCFCFCFYVRLFNFCFSNVLYYLLINSSHTKKNGKKHILTNRTGANKIYQKILVREFRCFRWINWPNFQSLNLTNSSEVINMMRNVELHCWKRINCRMKLTSIFNNRSNFYFVLCIRIFQYRIL